MGSERILATREPVRITHQMIKGKRSRWEERDGEKKGRFFHHNEQSNDLIAGDPLSHRVVSKFTQGEGQTLRQREFTLEEVRS